MVKEKTKPTEKSIFVKTFGDTPLIRILDFLLCEGLYFDYSLSDIARNSDVSWSTLHLVWPKLEKKGFVRQTRTVGRAKMFQTNKDNLVIKKLIELDRELTKAYADKIKVAVKV